MKEPILTPGEIRSIQKQIEANDERMEELLIEMEKLNKESEELFKKLETPKKFFFF